MKRDLVAIAQIEQKYAAVGPYLSELARRIWAGTEAKVYGYGGVTLVHQATGISRITIHKGLKEIETPPQEPPTRIRKIGGGRKKTAIKMPDALRVLESLIEPTTRGHPESALKWTTKSTAKLSEALKEKGFSVSAGTVSHLLKQMDYSLQGNKKTQEGKEQPDRDEQFCYINDTVEKAIQQGNPAISIDTKKKELIGNFKNNGREYSPTGQPIKVNTHDFPDKELGKAVPYGVYDLMQNQGWISVGVSSDTAEFAVNTIRTWWQDMGKPIYEYKKELVITADCGGSNSSRTRLFKFELQQFANETGLTLHIRHFPPGTSKWNKIEHKLFSFVSMNWRGRPLTSLQTIISLISNTRTTSGLIVHAVSDLRTYKTGIIVDDVEFENINIKRDVFHPEWNYSIYPKIV
jgi:hypothetical protein